MEYILKSAKANGLPFEKRDNPVDPNSPKTYGIKVVIKTGIVNQEYTGFENLDIGFCPILKTDDINVILDKINTYSLAFVSDKYPNT